MDNIGKVLIEKLTSTELAKLCDTYDDGNIEMLFVDFLLPRDVENRPEVYIKLDNNNDKIDVN